MIDPVSSLEGGPRLLGDIFPGTYFMPICRGTFNKALGFADLGIYLLPLILAILLMVGSSVLLLDKQER
jgi:ribosome-dependent ATPase